MKEFSQWSLFAQRRFAPFFWTQFLGAFNDNVYKNALIMYVTFEGLALTTINTTVMVNICAGLFILPFFLFAATAGQLADKYQKSVIVRWVKGLEVVISGCVALAFYFNSLFLLVLVLFLLGTQATLFSPVKYSILPHYLPQERELIAGNAWVGSSTFLAILLGTLCGGLLIAMENGPFWVSVAVFIFALMGFGLSWMIPPAPSMVPNLKIHWNIFTETGRNLAFAQQNPLVFMTILGISWFWAYGGVILTITPGLGKEILQGNEYVVTGLLMTFSVGIAIGAFLFGRLSKGRLQLKWIPFALLGTALSALHLFWIAEAELIIKNWIWFDCLLLGIFGGFYIVPLYTLLQTRSIPEVRSRIVATNSILNALFMVIAASLSAVAFALGLKIPQLFLIIGIVNLLVMGYVFLHFRYGNTLNCSCQ